MFDLPLTYESKHNDCYERHGNAYVLMTLQTLFIYDDTQQHAKSNVTFRNRDSNGDREYQDGGGKTHPGNVIQDSL